MEYYGNPKFGLLKQGVGLVVDLGGVQEVSSVQVTVQGEPTSFDILAAPDGSGAPSRSCLVHGDLDLRHVLLDPGTAAVLAVTGWGRAHAGHPLADLARLLGGGPPGELRRAALAAYAERHGGTAEELEQELALR